MTKSELKQKLEAVRDEMAVSFENDVYMADPEGIDSNPAKLFSYGVDTLLPLLLDAYEALEFYSKIENLGKTVWEDDSRDGKCWLEDFDNYEIQEIYSENSTGDFGIKSSETLARIEAFATQGAHETLSEFANGEK